MLHIATVYDIVYMSEGNIEKGQKMDMREYMGVISDLEYKQEKMDAEKAIASIKGGDYLSAIAILSLAMASREKASIINQTLDVYTGGKDAYEQA